MSEISILRTARSSYSILANKTTGKDQPVILSLRKPITLLPNTNINVATPSRKIKDAKGVHVRPFCALEMNLAIVVARITE